MTHTLSLLLCSHSPLRHFDAVGSPVWSETLEDFNEGTLQEGGSDGTLTRGDTSAATWVSRGVRVRLPFHDHVRGMVAEVSEGEVEVATEGAEWVVIKSTLVPQYIQRDEDDMGSSHTSDLMFTSVMGFTFEGKKQQQVSGMLIGTCPPLFGGKVPAYYAHYVRPTLARNPNLRPNACVNVDKHELQSFAIGDIVEQLMPASGHTAACAVIIRVLYSRRNGRVQARKWLVLAEVHKSEAGAYSPSIPISFFPASWVNWERVPSAERGTWTSKADRDSPNAQCLKLCDAQVMQVEQVRAGV